MERHFHHPRGMHFGREAGPWFPGADIPHENSCAGRPFSRWNQDCQNPRWGQGPPGPPNPQWDYNPWWGQDHQNSQNYPAPQWDQHHPEQPRDYGCGFDNGNFSNRGRGFYRRRSRGRFSGKRSSNFYKGKNSSHSSSRVLAEMQQQSKKENDSEVKKDESVLPKETKQAQEDSVASVKNTDPPQASQESSKANVSPSQFSFCLPLDSLTSSTCSPAKTEDTELVSQKASKAIISPSQFSFRLPPDSLTCPLFSPGKTEDAELTKLSTGSKTEDSHQVACHTQAATAELPATMETLELKKEDKEIELDKLRDTQATEARPSQAASPPSAKASMEGQAGSFHPVIKEEPMPVIEAHCCPRASLASAKAPSGKQAPSETMKDSCPVVKEEPDTEAHCNQAASLASDEAPVEKKAPSKVTESVHPMVKEEPVPVPEAKQDVSTASSTDPSSVTELSAPSCVVEPPAPLETREALLSLGREEDELLESGQPTDHFSRVDSPPAVEGSFLSDTTHECQSEGKEDLDLTQVGGSHKDTDSCQACDAPAGGSSALPVIPSDVYSVPVLVSGKETGQPYFWESEPSLHAQNSNWSDGGKGWAPEDYQEPSWGVDKVKTYNDVSELERNLVPSRSSFHSHYSSDQNPDTGGVLECHSSSSKSHHNSDSKHSSALRTIKCLRSPLRQDHHSRSPLRKTWRSRSPVRQDSNHSWDSSGSSGGREITRTDCCCKCHCKCCQNSTRERIQEELPQSYSTHIMHHYHPSKETSKSYRMSRSYSPENSTMTRKRKSTHHEETKKGRSSSVKPTKSSKTRKRKPTHHEETKKGRSSSVKLTKSSKVTINGGKVQAPVNHDAALAVETSLPAETTEHLEPANTEAYELVHLAPSSEDTGFPQQPCAEKETGTSAPSKILEDPRSVAVLTKRNQIEQDYLQVVLNFAVVATLLLQKEPCMEQALEAALRANMRSVGDYYESMLKNFIDNYDLSETR